MPYDADYSALLRLFVLLVQSQAGTKIEPGNEWLNDAQTLATKLFRHLVSMQRLAASATLGGDGIPPVTFVDHASTKVVARAAFETYLVFFYIYGNADRSLCKFRHTVWRLGGLADRQEFHVSTEQHRTILAAEGARIEELRAEIGASPHFRAYTDRQKKKLLEGDWRIGSSWADLSKSADFHETYFNNVYSYLCGYSHSSYISAMQVGEAQSIEDQRMLARSILGIGLVLMAHFAFSYANVFDTAKAALLANPSMKDVAEKWRLDAESMASRYGS